MVEYALITGASSGLGLEFARIAASNNLNLILISRNSNTLIKIQKEFEEQYKIKVLAIGCDLTEPNAVEKVTELLHTRQIMPTVLINNAGFGTSAPFNLFGAQSDTKMIQLNVVALTELTKVIYRQMLKAGKGKILNVSSFAGFVPGPWMAVYYATKAYVTSFSQALAAEAKGSGVTVTALCPGLVATNFENRVSVGTTKPIAQTGKVPTAAEVADFGWKSMNKGKTIAVYGWKLKFLLFVMRFLPRKTSVKIVSRLQRNKG
jgi:short-subunit dehydrogenase